MVLRRVLAAACAGTALLLLVGELRPPPPSEVAVVAAARAVRAGTVLGEDDLRTVPVPERGLQPGALREVAEALGRRTGSALAPGETVTRTRLVPRGPAEGLPAGRVVVHVTLADPLAAEVLPAGQDVLVFAAVGGDALARHAVVLATDPPASETVPGLDPLVHRGVVLSLPASEAEAVLSGHGGLDGLVVVNVVAAGGP